MRRLEKEKSMSNYQQKVANHPKMARGNIKWKIGLFWAVAMVIGGTAFAQDDLVFKIRATKSCLRDAATDSERRDCIGAAASQCMSATATGTSTYGMGACIVMEGEWWDKQLNTVYGALMAREKADDVESSAMSENIPLRAPALRDMQKAWITFRDLTCAYERSLFGGGTGGGPASANCFMHLTAEQTLYLQSGLQEY